MRNYHYDPKTQRWDSKPGQSTGVFQRSTGWVHLVYVQGGLTSFGPFRSETEARADHKAVMDNLELKVA